MVRRITKDPMTLQSNTSNLSVLIILYLPSILIYQSIYSICQRAFHEKGWEGLGDPISKGSYAFWFDGLSELMSWMYGQISISSSNETFSYGELGQYAFPLKGPWELVIFYGQMFLSSSNVTVFYGELRDNMAKGSY